MRKAASACPLSASMRAYSRRVSRRPGTRFSGTRSAQGATSFAVRYSPELRAGYQRKAARTKRVVALKALANKRAKACYFILRDGVEFDVKKLVG